MRRRALLKRKKNGPPRFGACSSSEVSVNPFSIILASGEVNDDISGIMGAFCDL